MDLNSLLIKAFSHMTMLFHRLIVQAGLVYKYIMPFITSVSIMLFICSCLFMGKKVYVSLTRDSGKSSYTHHNQRVSSSTVPSDYEEMKPRDALSSEHSNFVITTTKNKRRKRRNRKGIGAGMKGNEVLSGQSENSSPSSPMSPVNLTHELTWPLSPNVFRSVEYKNPFSGMGTKNCDEDEGTSIPMNPSSNCSTQEQFSKPKANGKPVVIASYARAPGSKLNDKSPVLGDEKAVCEKEFIYDIWGDHFSGLHLMSRSRDLSGMVSNAASTYSNSGSFFLRGPQSLKAEMRSVSYYIQHG